MTIIRSHSFLRVNAIREYSAKQRPRPPDANFFNTNLLLYCIYPPYGRTAGIPIATTYNKTETVVVYVAKVKSHGGAVAAHCAQHALRMYVSVST